MKKYTRPNAEIVVFEVEDIITASGVIADGVVTSAENLTGESAEMYTIYKNNSGKNENVSVFTW